MTDRAARVNHETSIQKQYLASVQTLEKSSTFGGQWTAMHCNFLVQVQA